MEKEQIENKKENKIWKKILVILIILALFLAGAIFTLNIFSGEDDAVEADQKGSVSEEPEIPKIEDVLGKIEEEDAQENDNLAGVSASENYRISQVRFGGNIALADERQKDLTVELYDIKSEMVSSREDEEPRFLLTWKTNKATISSILYAEDDGSNSQEFREENYGFEHSALLSDIKLSTIYVYRITARDRWGNEKSSDYFSMYTGEKSASIFDLIVSSIEDVFSWAIKK